MGEPHGHPFRGNQYSGKGSRTGTTPSEQRGGGAQKTVAVEYVSEDGKHGTISLRLVLRL
jgi:hypothetical protein